MDIPYYAYSHTVRPLDLHNFKANIQLVYGIILPLLEVQIFPTLSQNAASSLS